MRVFINFISGVVLGAIIGASTATILAPKSGPALRTDLRREVDHILDEGRKAAAEREHDLRQQLAVLRGDSK